MKQNKILGELVTFKSSAGLHLDGIFYQRDKNRRTIIHVHGSYGNFYQNKFLRLMAEYYLNAGINFLSFNLSGHDGVSEGYRNVEEFEYVGGAVYNFEECVSDIDGAISFVKDCSDMIILQGHSLGCDRILHYLITTKICLPFILLSPCDSYQLQCNWIYPEKVENQIKRLTMEDKSIEFDWLPSREYGIRQGAWTYVIPVTRKTALSIMSGSPFKLMKISQPSDFYIECKALIYIGKNDLLQTVDSNTMYKYLENRISLVKRVYDLFGDHNLSGCEEEVIQQIVKWVKTL
jgi:hypothetical protein